MELNIGQKIKELRRRDSRTQEDLADALGITFQAVSRWESSLAYPDMELIPPIANYFGVTIDELFGYESRRESRIDELVSSIRQKDRENNGRDVCIDECIQMAREAMAEYPSSEKVMHCLADLLYNAGFARHGEHHVVDDEGFDKLDTERHKTYSEWQEAIKLYEKLVDVMGDGEERERVLRYLINLYSEIGESEKGAKMAEHFSKLVDCRELTTAYAYDGRTRADNLSYAILELVSLCAEQMVQAYITRHSSIEPKEAVRIIENAISMFDLVCTDGEYGFCNRKLATLYLYLSTHKWRSGDHDGAFESLDRAYECGKKFHSYNGNTEITYTAPLLSAVKINPEGYDSLGDTDDLPEYFPSWCVPYYGDVAREMKADPRWSAWCTLCTTRGKSEEGRVKR